MLASITRILERCGSDRPVMPPTELFNEGWMLRLVLDWFDRHREAEHALSFQDGVRWYSEALLPSRFLPRSRIDGLAETHTHADGVVGHFDIAPSERGDAHLRRNAKQLVVIEAKLGSPLSAGTKNAPDYDQAARNVACIAHMLAAADIAPASMDRLSFFVIAPEAQIRSGVFADLVAKPSIEAKVRSRVGAYDGAHDAWLNDGFLRTLVRMEVRLLSWESILDALPRSEEAENIRTFYTECLRFNPLRSRTLASD